MKNNSPVIVRFPPSPTGFFHIGGVRTALFNFLFARHHGGRFILRIEDTDAVRSKKEFEENILESMRWLGLEWDDFARQSDRVDIHRTELQKLLDNGMAYISQEKVEKEGDRPEVIRLRNPGKMVTFHDEIRGDISVDTTDLGDFIIARSPTEPLYHFSVVVDDFLMGITHVIRGEDHISNTPRQILLQEALGAPRPIYAHVPLILAADRSKLSKRKHGERVALSYYRDAGFLREAMINYTALLGWNPNQGEREIFSLEEMIKMFDVSQIQKAGAIFNEEKLRWFNREYLRALPTDILTADIEKMLTKKYPVNAVQHMLPKILPVIRERISVISDVTMMANEGEFSYYFETPQLDDKKISWKSTDKKTTANHLQKIISLLNELPEDFDSEKIKAMVWPYAEAVGRGEVLWPMRYALSGREKSPDPFTLAAILGKKKTLERLEAARTSIS